MRALAITSEILTSFGLFLWCIFQLFKNAIKWPVFITENLDWICYGSIALGYLLIVLYYFQSKNSRKARQLVIFASIITAIFFGVYFLSR